MNNLGRSTPPLLLVLTITATASFVVANVSATNTTGLQQHHVTITMDASLPGDSHSASLAQAVVPTPFSDLVTCKEASSRPDPCTWVRENCNDLGMINYLETYYCSELSTGIAVVLAIVWFLFLVYVMATVTEQYFFCGLVQLVGILRLSPNLAGVTLLAVGNGTPDLFSSFVAITNGSPGIGFGVLIGGCMMVSSLVAGVITISHPTKLSRRPFLRDVVFYSATVIAVFLVLLDGHISVYESAAFVGAYLAYLLVIFLARHINQEMKFKQRTRLGIVPKANSTLLDFDTTDDTSYVLFTPLDDTEVMYTCPPSHQSNTPFYTATATPIDPSSPTSQTPQLSAPPSATRPTHTFQGGVGYEETLPLGSGQSYQPPNTATTAATTTYKIGAEPSSPLSPEGGKDGSPYLNQDPLSPTHADDFSSYTSHFRLSVQARTNASDQARKQDSQRASKEGGLRDSLDNFLAKVEWPEKNMLERAFLVVKFPVDLLLAMTIPAPYDWQWNKWMAVGNPLFSALFLVVVVKVATNQIGGIPVVAIAAMVGLAVSLVVFATSSTEKPPRYQKLLSVFSFMMGAFWMYAVSEEYVGLLRAVGIVLGIEEQLLGFTVLTWANSVSDIVANVVVARRGFPNIAIGACLGGPPFNLLLGLGLPLLVETASQGHDYDLSSTLDDNITLALAFLLVAVLTSGVCVIVLKYSTSRNFGVYLVALYTAFLIVAILSEEHVIDFEV